jgi:hypothetical protein
MRMGGLSGRVSANPVTSSGLLANLRLRCRLVPTTALAGTV